MNEQRCTEYGVDGSRSLASVFAVCGLAHNFFFLVIFLLAVV